MYILFTVMEAGFNKVIVLDALEGMRMLSASSVQTIVTSPPYFHQRDYGYAGQWGQENTPEEYVQQLVALFSEARRVLVDSGTIWLVLGDSYAGGRRGGQTGRFQYGQAEGRTVGVYEGIKRKDLLGMPWMVAFALRADGWYFRQDVIWYKTRAMPESVTDRCTRCHEYIFMFSKGLRYYYNHMAIATELKKSSVDRLRQNIAGQQGSARVYGKKNGLFKTVYTPLDHKQDGHGRRHEGFNERWKQPVQGVANRKSVWPIPPGMSKEDHFASFPDKIPELCIRASTREGDLVLDPFAGTGTTLLQASILGRRYLGFDLSAKYVGIAQRRLKELEGVFYRG
jgi:DNA modification methylase